MARRITYADPVMPWDYPRDDAEIHPCPDCLPWYVEVYVHPEGTSMIREWHAVGCPIWNMFEAQDRVVEGR